MSPVQLYPKVSLTFFHKEEILQVLLARTIVICVFLETDCPRLLDFGE